MLLHSSIVLSDKMFFMTNPRQWHPQRIMVLVVTTMMLLVVQHNTRVMAFSTSPLSSSFSSLISVRRTTSFTSFTSSSHGTTPAIRKSSSSLPMTFSLTDLPNPFNTLLNTQEEDDTNNNNNNNSNDNDNDDFVPTPEALVARAKLILATDLAINGDYDNLLSPDFIWVTPSMGSRVLGKTDYIAQGKFFNLRQTFPDLNYRPYDFRIDARDATTIRFTARTTGTMRQSLRLRNKVVAPANGETMKCPPEAISMTFDPVTGQLRKLCSGFALDRFVGNTQGLCGVQGAAVIAGNPPSDLEVYPLTAIVQKLVGRPTSPLVEPESFLAPFPETVMIQLVKGIISATMAADDPDLLSSSQFTFSTPTQGPVGKQTYLNSFATQVLGAEFEGHEVELTHLRVDPYDPYRVWVDVLPTSSAKGGDYQGSPQAMSFTFDDDGFCERITAWAVMDPSVGNGGGLGGTEGYKYATGTAGVGIGARPLPDVLGRFQKKIFEPITNIGVDEFVTTKKTVVPGSGDTTEDNDRNDVVGISSGGDVPSTTQTPLEKLADQAITPPPSSTTNAQTKSLSTRSTTFKIPQIGTNKKPDTPVQTSTAKPPTRATTIKMPTFKITPPKGTTDKNKQGTTRSPPTSRKKASTTTKVPTRKIPPKQPPAARTNKKNKTATTPTRANTIKMPTSQIPNNKKNEVTKGKPAAATKASPPKRKKRLPTRSMTNRIPIPTFKIPSKTVENKPTTTKKKSPAPTRATTLQMPTFSIGSSRPTQKVQVPSSRKKKMSSTSTNQKTQNNDDEGASIIASVKRVQAEMAAEKQTKISNIRQSGRKGVPSGSPKAKGIFSATTEKVLRAAASAKEVKLNSAPAGVKKFQEPQEAKTSKTASKKPIAAMAKTTTENAASAKRAREVASAAKTQAAERKAKAEAQAAERKANAKAQFAERKARAEAQVADRKARAEAEAVQRIAKAKAQVADRKAKAELQAADRKAKVAAAAAVAEKKKKAKAAAQAFKAQRGGTFSLVMGQKNNKKATKDDTHSTRAKQTSFPFFASASSVKSNTPRSSTKSQKKQPQQKQVAKGKAAAPKNKEAKGNKPEELSIFSFFGSSEKTPVVKTTKPAATAARASPSAKKSGGGGGTFSLGSVFQQNEKTKEKTTKNKKRKNPVSSSSFFNSAGATVPAQRQVRPKVKPAPRQATKKVKELTKPVRATKSVPPKGVPVLQKWRQNGNGTISASISGSASFADGEIVTTSKIVSGKLSSGSVVVTGSGSRYFLN